MNPLSLLLGIAPTAGATGGALPIQSAQPQPQQPDPMQGYQHGLGGFLRRMQDGLLAYNGLAPMHMQQAQQAQQQQALGGFLTNPDQAIAALMKVPGQAATAIDLYKAVHPASETPLELKLLEHLKEHPEDAGSLHQIDAELHPGLMTPTTVEPGSYVQQPGSVPPSAADYLKAHPELAPQFDQKYGPGASAKILGGQTASPSGNFLDAVTSQTESGGHDLTPSGAPVTSPKGAKYGMQVLPSTARDPGFGVSAAASDTPAEYDRVGSQYRSALLQKYGGNLARMWAAYNMGPGALDNAISKYGEDWLSHVPQSVRGYVSSNLKSAGAL